MSERPHMVREWKIPVVRPLGTTFATEEVAPRVEMPEYWVVEEWSDETMRHPTSGVTVTMELWRKYRRVAEAILRTGGAT